MGREIKFRFWSGEKMFYDIQNVMECLKQQMYFNTKGEPIGYDHIGLHGASFMQFTGLKDKKGREIYEGDVVKSRHIGSKPLSVIYDDNEAAFKFLQDEYYMGMLANRDHEEIEIIGNIHENPELLK